MTAEGYVASIIIISLLGGGYYLWNQSDIEQQQKTLMEEPGSRYLGPHKPELVEGYSGYHPKHDEGGVIVKICRNETRIYRMPDGKYITDACDLLFGCIYHDVAGPNICE